MGLMYQYGHKLTAEKVKDGRGTKRLEKGRLEAPSDTSVVRVAHAGCCPKGRKGRIFVAMMFE